MSIVVRTFTGEALARSEHKALNRLFAAAASKGHLFTGCVDPYDDTIFNRLQVRSVLLELEALLPFLATDEAAAAVEVKKLAELVCERPHRYLAVSGD